jgi:dienelactone hydrolase
MKILLALMLVMAMTAVTAAQDVVSREVRFFSDGAWCYGRLYVPKFLGPDSKARAVVLAPGWMQTETSIDKYASRFAARGLVAMAIDYRGWGRSGGYVYLAETIRVDDRQRFSQHTARVRIRRRRLVPTDQVLDIRNAVAFLQGEPGVDPGRVGVWGIDMAGGHVIVAAASDARIKAAVAQVPIIEGKDTPKRAAPRPPALHAAELKLARTAAPSPSGVPPGTDAETRIALADYHPFWFASQVPETAAILFVIAERDMRVNNENHAVATSKLLRGPTGVTVLEGATHAVASPKAVDAAAEAAAAWFLKYLE